MFNKGIYSLTLACEAADRLFSNITASGVLDESFIATLRALLRNRLPKDEKVRFDCKELYLTVSDIATNTPSGNMQLFIPDELYFTDTSEHSIFLVHTADKSAGEKMLELVRAYAGEGKRFMSNFTLLEDLRVFYARKINALFYTNTTTHSTVIFAGMLELKTFHALQMMIPKYLPDLFSTTPLTENEAALLKSLGNKTAIEYETLITEFSKGLDIRAEIIRIKLAGFETAFERVRADEIRREISHYESDYDAYLSTMRELSRKIQDRQYALSGLDSVINSREGDSELMEYFMCNKNLIVISANGTAIEFISHGYADIFDEDAFEQYVGNHGGYLYNLLNPAVTKQQMEKLYRSLFSERQYKLRLCAAYSVDMRNGLRALSHYSFPSESNGYLPNPHIQLYGCIGNYAGRFQEYMRKKDYVGAIDQAVVSGRNLNLYDSTVMSSFATELSRTHIKCIEKPDGTTLSPLEAIKELEGGAICQGQS